MEMVQAKLGNRLGMVKDTEKALGKVLDTLQNSAECDARLLAMARTQFEIAFMVLTKAQFRRT